MVKVIWTHDSLDNMNEIADKVAEMSVNYAALLIKRFFEAEKYLANFPKLGRNVPEMASIPNLREIIVEGYRIVYQFDDELNEIKILGVKHSSNPLSGN